MSPPTSIQSPVRAAGACLLVTLCVSGCQDSPTDPTAALVAEDTRTALHLDGALPSLPDLAARERVEDRVAEAVGRWVVSWEHAPEEGAALRSGAYDAAAPTLAEAMGRSDVALAVEQVGAALEATTSLERARLPEGMADRLERARLHHRAAREALASGDEAGALHGALRASDVFREVGPHGVALALLTRAEGALAQALDGGALADEDVERTERLVRGARQALDQEDWSRAIQRAYYACQLLGIQLQ